MIVADTNVVAYLIIAGERTQSAEAVRAQDRNWVAPPILRHEILNVLATYVTSGRMERDEAVKYYRRALALVSVSDLEPDPVAILGLCRASGCSAYDGEYVALARSLGVPLVTTDKQILDEFPETAVSMEAFLRTSA